MKYVRSLVNQSWIGKIDDNTEIPDKFIEISEEEYLQVQREIAEAFKIDDPCEE